MSELTSAEWRASAQRDSGRPDDIRYLYADALDEIERLKEEATLAAIREKCNEFADSDICVKGHEIARTVLAMLDGTAQEEPNGGPQS